MALRTWPAAGSVPGLEAIFSNRLSFAAEAQAVKMLCERCSIGVALGRAREGLAVRRRRRGVWMYDADVSVQQSVRASSPSRACVDGGCGCGCNYDGGIVQEIRRSRRCCRLIKHQAPRKRRNKGWRWRWWWQNSRRKQNSGVDLISSTRAFASSLALAPSKGDGPAFFAFQKLSSPLLGLG
jgi:hypothetical protein